MELSLFHFSNPIWLYALLVIPFVWLLCYFSRKKIPQHEILQFIDSHLLPYLLIGTAGNKNKRWLKILLWTAAWSFLIVALAGPRWSYREIDKLSKDQSLIILLDLSESMQATDTKPSRLIRAKQKIEDLLSLSKGVKIGLIAFAADPHMITPITDDKKNIRHLLPSLDTDLVHIQGSKLSPALEMASAMFDAEPGKNKSIVVISDGGFEDSVAMREAKKLADKGIVIHSIGVGTLEGAPLKDHKGNIIKKNGSPILSKLEEERLTAISKNGSGHYFEAHYTDLEAATILEELENRAETEVLLGKEKIWEEHFFLALLPILPIILWWFKDGRLFALLPFLLTPLFPLDADFSDFFKNSDQIGKEAFEQQDYECAEQSFKDPYRKGVSCYRAGKFSEAEDWFRQSDRAEISCNATYNLGNSLVQQNKLKEAIVAYEAVIEKWPEHAKAKENLELAKKMLEEQKPPTQEQKSDSENQQDQQKDSSESEQSSHSDDNKDQKNKSDQNQDNEEQEDVKDHIDDRKDENHENKDQESEPLQSEEPNETGQIEQEKSEEEKNEDQTIQKSEEEMNADLWLNRLNNDPKTFMKNKFYIETKKSGIQEEVNPW